MNNTIITFLLIFFIMLIGLALYFFGFRNRYSCSNKCLTETPFGSFNSREDCLRICTEPREKIVEKPVEVEKLVEKIIHVPYEVEKRVEVPVEVEKPVYLDRPIYSTDLLPLANNYAYLGNNFPFLYQNYPFNNLPFNNYPFGFGCQSGNCGGGNGGNNIERESVVQNVKVNNIIRPPTGFSVKGNLRGSPTGTGPIRARVQRTRGV